MKKESPVQNSKLDEKLLKEEPRINASTFEYFKGRD